MKGPVSDENYFEWEAAITGPLDTVFEDGVFIAKLSFPQDYPLNPPKMRFLSKIFHPNIYPDGRVCISILHAPGKRKSGSSPINRIFHLLNAYILTGDDPTGYEKSSERWSPVQSVEKVLISVMSMLAEPNIESPANVDAAKMFRSGE